MKPLSFRLKIALLSALISALVLVAFGGAAWFWMKHERLAGLDREIRALAYRHPGWMGNRLSYERLSSAIEFIFGSDRKERLILSVLGDGGKTLFASEHWPEDLDPESLDLNLQDDPDAPASAPAAQAGEEELDGEGVGRRGPRWAGGGGGGGGGLGRGGAGRGLGAGQTVVFTKIPKFQSVRTGRTIWRIGVMGSGDVRLIVGLDCAEMQTELNRMRNAFLVALPVALFLVGLGGWVVSGHALRPLRTIARTAERVTAQGLGQRIPLSEEDPEISRLITVLNRMMDRLEVSFRQAVRFSADASHQLKTPLSIMQGELENALQGAAAGSAEQQVFSNLLEETERLKTITRSLLLLARADAGQLQLNLVPVNLAEQLQGVVEDAEVLGAGQQLSFETEVPAGLWVKADWPLLQQAIFNLIGNASKYNQPGGRVRVVLAGTGGRVELNIGNTGPGIPPEEQSRVFDRFCRLDAARNRGVDGVGLGLSLAREIARAHRGDVVLKESRNGWTCFSLTLPAD